MRGTDVDQTRFFAPGDDFDREPKRGLGLRQEGRRVLGDAQRVGRDGAHGLRLKTAQAFGEALQCFKRAHL